MGISTHEKCGEKPLGKYGLARYLSKGKDSKLMHMGLKKREKRFSVCIFNMKNFTDRRTESKLRKKSQEPETLINGKKEWGRDEPTATAVESSLTRCQSFLCK